MPCGATVVTVIREARQVAAGAANANASAAREALDDAYRRAVRWRVPQCRQFLHCENSRSRRCDERVREAALAQPEEQRQQHDSEPQRNQSSNFLLRQPDSDPSVGKASMQRDSRDITFKVMQSR